MQNFPNKIRVSAFDFNVLISPSLDAEGYFDSESLTITLGFRKPHAAILEALLHEVGHAVNYVADINDESSEEDSIRRSTPIWLGVWRDNPKLLALLNSYANEI